VADVTKLRCVFLGCTALPTWCDVIILLRDSDDDRRHRAAILCEAHAAERQNTARSKLRAHYADLLRALNGGKPVYPDNVVFAVEPWG
jgi:hypothetical protein